MASNSTNLPERWALLTALQGAYPTFRPFCEDVFELLGLGLDNIAADIADFLQYGPQDSMVQAQRGQSKTTVAAAFAVWTLIHAPACRVIVISAGADQASDISYLIRKIIMEWDILECIRPGDTGRSGVDAFDLHVDLKGIDKSPSVACYSAGANLQGPRADLLLADAVESRRNSETEKLQEKLAAIAADFSSVVGQGKMVWLGTPQHGDSLYNQLPDQGCTVRVWTGRYPTPEQMKYYEGRLAPMLLQHIEADPSLQRGGGFDGTQGQPTCPRLGEDLQRRVEAKQGRARYLMQHMLITAALDKNRYALDTRQFVILRGPGRNGLWPIHVTRGMTDKHIRRVAAEYGTFDFSTPSFVSEQIAPLERVVASIDPAAGVANGDATAITVGGVLNHQLFLR